MVTLFIVNFDDVSIQKYDPLIIVMIIIKLVNGYAIRGSAEKWQIHTTAAKAGIEIIVLYNVKSILTDNSI